jgi:hypothetical protein
MPPRLVARSTIGSEVEMIASSAGSSRSIRFPSCAAASRQMARLPAAADIANMRRRDTRYSVPMYASLG